jgi:hypothetical protein
MIDLIFVVFGLSIMLLFMFKIEWLFANGVIFWRILTYCFLSFGLSLYLLSIEYYKIMFINNLKIPLISFLIFRVFFFLFKKKYKRNPENTFGEFQKKPIQDIIFTILYWLLGVGLPYFYF